mgnify:CR=1 FL=1
MLNEEIKVTENGGKTVTVLTLEDCEKYHGLKRCGGLALCFRVMKFALDRLVPEGEAARRKLITFKLRSMVWVLQTLLNSSADV